MKNRWKILSGVLATVLLFSSCDHFFDVDLADAVEEDEFYTHYSDLNSVAYSFYAALSPEAHKFLLWGSARGDMVTNGSEEDAYVTQFVNNDVTADNPYTNYAFLYKAIARCNQQLVNLYNVQPDEFASRDYLDQFYGEAYFVRAFCYFWLVRTFKNFPLVEEDVSNTLTYVSGEGDTLQARTLSLSNEDIRSIALQPAEEQDVWSLIQSDLNRALELVNAVPQWTADGYGSDITNLNQEDLALLSKIRPTPTSIGLLAAEVAMWLGQYEKAAGYASAGTQLSLGSEDAWHTQFTGSITNGIEYTQFSLAYLYNQAYETNRLQEFTSPVEEDGGRYLLMPVMSVYNQVYDEPEDCRRISAVRIDRQPVIWKYIGADGEGELMRESYESDASFPFIKTADAYLWEGIACCRIGDYATAFKNLNAIRDARGLGRYDESEYNGMKDQLEELLFKERTRENAYEGRRWYDLMLMERMGYTGILGEEVSKKYTDPSQAAEVKTKLANPDAWYLPIEPDNWN